MYEDIEAVLDEHVRPLLRTHGGEMEIIEVEDGVVRFKLKGKCAGCPAADLTTEELLRACDYCGVKSGRDVDKFKELHLTPLAMQHVSAVGISESPVNIECRVRKSEELGSHTMFIADVVGVTVDDKYMDGTGKFHINDTGLVMYSHGEYFGFGDKLGSFGYSVRKTKK